MADNSTRIVLTAEDKTGAAFASVKNGIAQLQAASSSLGAAFGLGLGGAGALAGLVATTKATIDAADALAKLSQKTGFAVESLSALKYAGSLSDVSLDQLATGVKKLSNNMAEFAGKGTGEAADAFRAIGINVKDASGNLKSGEAVFNEIADSFSGMEDGAGKTAIAMRLFGKSGADLIPLLNGGSAGLREMRGEAEAMGIVMSKDLAKASEEFNDNLTRLKASMEKTGITIANVLLPSLVSLSEALINFSRAGAGAEEVHWEWLDNLVNRGSTGLQTLTASFNEAAAATARFLGMKGLAAQYDQNAARAREVLGNLAVEKQVNAERGVDLDAFGGKKSPYSFNKKKAPLLTPQPTASAGQKEAASFLANDARDIEAVIKRNEDLEKSLRHVGDEFDKLGRKRDEAFALSGLAPAAAALQRELAAIGEKAEESKIKLRELFNGEDTEGYRRGLAEIDAAQAAAADSARRNADAVAAQNASFEFGASQALLTYLDTVNNVAKQTENAVARAFGGMEDALVNFVKTGKLDFKSLADSIISDLVRIQVQQSITKPLAQALNDSGGLGNFFSSLFGGARADGGPVAFGKAYLVGERGPELFLPGSSGSIVPNVSPASAAAPVTITQHINVDSRSDLASIRQAMVVARDQAVSAVLSSKRRGGAMA